MCGIICSSVVIAVGAALVVGSCVLSFIFVPDIIKNVIKDEVVLINNTIQMERFETVPFALRFSVRLFNLTNPDAVMAGGVPVVEEVGPWVYQLYQTRELTNMTHDRVWYHRHEHFEFDPVASYPNKEEDMVTIVNVPYHAISQVAENLIPNLMIVFNQMLDGIFGEYNSPIATFKIRDLLFNGIPLCKDAGLTAALACNIIRQIGEGSMNIEELEDGSLTFAVLEYKDRYPSLLYEVDRGLSEPTLLGDIIRYNESSYFNYWRPYSDEEPGVCNMINGTDAGIFRPFVDRTKSIYAINTDICRSVELRYQYDSEYEGIPTVRYSANEWLFANDDGCFCLNVTRGHNREDGCLLKGAMELFSCVGATLVLSYPHFLYADQIYANGVIGMHPDEENHRIFMDIEPNTGTPIVGAKRAQFNVFMRHIPGISETQHLRTTLVPFLWIEEALYLPEEFVNELTGRLLHNLRLVDILIPVLIAVCCVVFVAGIGLTIRAKRRKERTPLLSNDAPLEN
ncbi:unnamed protein product [Chrysodeixis includens]|uniref:Sensory neuron membrane protein 2 n=1 Tax=Chrysodeixis includens TaxID=689277 RepID=A0A9P0BL66_CHRIL|nr:unnamed protein product [Chrysodeixis includens]